MWIHRKLRPQARFRHNDIWMRHYDSEPAYVEQPAKIMVCSFIITASPLWGFLEISSLLKASLHVLHVQTLSDLILTSADEVLVYT